jgi:hypothetical protein
VGKRNVKELWERIKHKTRYAVKIDSGKLIAEVVPQLDKMKVRPPRVAITKAQVQLGSEDAFEALQMSAAKTAVSLVGRYPLPNLVEIMANLMQHTTPPVHLTRQTLLQVFQGTRNRKAATENPHEFATETVRILKESLADHLVNGLQEAMHTLRDEDESLAEVAIGAGIYTGYAVVGNLGSERMMNYTCVGDTPNAAKRLQENAIANQILICPATYEAVSDAVVVKPMGPMMLKGRVTPVQAYEVLSLKSSEH